MKSKISKMIDDYQKAAYNADCNEGLTGYRTLDEEKINEILAMPEEEAEDYINSLYDNL